MEEADPLLTLNSISLAASLQRAKVILEDCVDILKWEFDLRCQRPKLRAEEETTDNILCDCLPWTPRTHFTRSRD
jgi:hypothetical protein